MATSVLMPDLNLGVVRIVVVKSFLMKWFALNSVIATSQQVLVRYWCGLASNSWGLASIVRSYLLKFSHISGYLSWYRRWAQLVWVFLSGSRRLQRWRCSSLRSCRVHYRLWPRDRFFIRVVAWLSRSFFSSVTCVQGKAAAIFAVIICVFSLLFTFAFITRFFSSTIVTFQVFVFFTTFLSRFKPFCALLPIFFSLVLPVFFLPLLSFFPSLFSAYLSLRF